MLDVYHTFGLIEVREELGFELMGAFFSSPVEMREIFITGTPSIVSFEVP